MIASVRRRAVAYVRKSNEPGEDNTSLQDQRTWAVAEAGRRGAELRPEDIFLDVVSGWQDNKLRPDRDKVVEEILTGSVEMVLVRDLDRLGRRMVDLTRIVEDCRRHGVTIVTADRVYKPGDPETSMIVGVMSGLAEAEATRTSQRLRRKAAETRLRGGWNGQAPFGWEKAPRDADGVLRLRLHPEEAPVLRSSVERVLTGSNIPETVAALAAEGVVTRTGRPWSYRAVANALRHPLLAGYQSHVPRDQHGRPTGEVREITKNTDGKPLKAHGALVTPEEFDALQHVVRPRSLKSTRRTARGLPLGGLVFCEGCGHRMISSRRSGSYVCDAK